MVDVISRLLLLVSFIAYMAAIYVTLHIVVARFSNDPGSRLRWFFSVLTAPLTYPFRVLLPSAMTEIRLRYVTLAACIAMWLAMRVLLRLLGGVQAP